MRAGRHSPDESGVAIFAGVGKSWGLSPGPRVDDPARCHLVKAPQRTAFTRRTLEGVEDISRTVRAREANSLMKFHHRRRS